jgi:hypothetical protein
MRSAAEDDFHLTLPDVGVFRYGRRTLGDRLAIRRDYLRYTQEFGDDDPDLSLYAALIATHGVLCVEAPAGWDDLAAVDAGALDKVFELGALIKTTEDTFRKGVEKSRAGESPVDGGHDRVSIPGALPSAAEGSPGSGADDRGHAG